MPVDQRKVARALLSVSDKTGLVEFARALAGHGVELVSTGGTRKALADAGLAVKDISDLTLFPEMMDGRLKTLHPKVHGGLLAIRENPEHEAAMLAHGIGIIDLLVVNLYPFEATLANGAGFDDCIENIDIGGPAMIRAAAKNHADVAVLVEPDDYGLLLDEMAANAGATSLELRRRLAQKAFARTAVYDAAIGTWLAAEIGEAAPADRPARKGSRRVFFDQGWAEVPVWDREALGAADRIEGPAIVEEPFATHWIGPGWHAATAAAGALIARRDA